MLSVAFIYSNRQKCEVKALQSTHSQQTTLNGPLPDQITFKKALIQIKKTDL